MDKGHVVGEGYQMGSNLEVVTQIAGEGSSLDQKVMYFRL